MKLFNHCEESISLSNDSLKLDNGDFQLSSNELSLHEDTFFKIFNLNPYPMTIIDINDGLVIDANKAFLEVVGMSDKNEIIGKTTVEKNIISNKYRNHMMNTIKKRGYLNNFCCDFYTLSGKKKTGMFSGSLFEISGKIHLLLICQLINKKFLTCIFKTFVSF